MKKISLIILTIIFCMIPMTACVEDKMKENIDVNNTPSGETNEPEVTEPELIYTLVGTWKETESELCPRDYYLCEITADSITIKRHSGRRGFEITWEGSYKDPESSCERYEFTSVQKEKDPGWDMFKSRTFTYENGVLSFKRLSNESAAASGKYIVYLHRVEE